MWAKAVTVYQQNQVGSVQQQQDRVENGPFRYTAHDDSYKRCRGTGSDQSTSGFVIVRQYSNSNTDVSVGDEFVLLSHRFGIYYLHQGTGCAIRSARLSFVLSFCRSVCRTTAKVISRFH